MSTCLPRIGSDFQEFTIAAWVANSYILTFDSFRKYVTQYDLPPLFLAHFMPTRTIVFKVEWYLWSKMDYDYWSMHSYLWFSSLWACKCKIKAGKGSWSDFSVCIEHDHADRLSSHRRNRIGSCFIGSFCDHLWNGTIGKTWKLSRVRTSLRPS